MCGIAGYFNTRDPAGAPALHEVLRHRGPDGEGRFVDEAVALYHSRLSIIDLSAAARQPMVDETGDVVLVYNGEIYNFQQERARLVSRGHSFHSNSDTEVVLRAYIEYGEECVRRFRGMFAFAIYDRRGGRKRERLLLARDPFGIKPLLVAESGDGGIVFASELKAILQSGMVRRRVDAMALRDLLTVGAVYQPRTLLEGVRSVRPGHWVVYEGRRRREQSYWGFGAGRVAELANASMDEAADAVDGALRESVRRQLVADVPVCSFLSGGIDSALITAMMIAAHDARVCTYSVGFASALPDIDEAADAAALARHLGTEHHEVTIEDRDILALTEHLGVALDQPSIDGVNSYFVSRAVSKSYKVALSGTGGDELFAGYPWFKATACYRAPAISHLAGISRRFISRFGHEDGRLGQLAFSDVPGYFSRQHQSLGLVGAMHAMAPDLRDASRGAPDGYLDIGTRDALRSAGTLNRCSALCLSGYTANQLLRDIDSMSMSCGVEVRVPFLDPVVADVALSLPAAVKVGVADTTAPAGSYAAEGIKRVLIEVGRRYLPQEFSRRPKRGFNMPVGDWLRGPLRELVGDVLSEARIKQGGLLDARFVTGLRKQVEQGDSPASSLWLVLVTSLWQEQVLSA